MSRDVVGGHDDGSPDQEGVDVDVDADLDPQVDAPRRSGRGPTSRELGGRELGGRELGGRGIGGRGIGARGIGARGTALVGRAPRAVATTAALAAVGLGWFAPELMAVAHPAPPLVVVTFDRAEFDAESRHASLTLTVSITNLGPAEVTVTGATEEGRALQLAPTVVGRGRTGAARLRLTPSCRGPAEPAPPRLQVSDGSGATAEVDVVGVAPLMSQACAVGDRLAPGAADVEPVTRLGRVTRDGDRLLLTLRTPDGRQLVLTAVHAGDIELSVESAPVALDGTPRQVALGPLSGCPAGLSTGGPPTGLVLTVTTPTPVATAPDTTAADGGLAAPQLDHRTYEVPLWDLPEVGSWLLRTACTGGLP